LVVWNMDFMFHFIYGMSSFPLTFIFFRGVGIPPTRYAYWGVRKKRGFRARARFISDCHGGSPVCSSMIGDLGLEKFGILVSSVWFQFKSSSPVDYPIVD
jgi:hypothetical protein